MTRRAPTPIPGCYATPCPKCGENSPCVDHVEVDIGVGVQTGEHQFYCTKHGLFGFSAYESGAIFQDDDAGENGR